MEKDEPAMDAFNFYLSQLRIRIEQTFGMMTTKWRILRQPLQVCQKHNGSYLYALQYCITSVLIRDASIQPTQMTV